jgi:hypothetical protein
VKLINSLVRKGNSGPVTGCEGPYGCEMLRVPHFLDNRLTDDGEAVILMCWPATPYSQEDSLYWFLLVTELTVGL